MFKVSVVSFVVLNVFRWNSTSGGTGLCKLTSTRLLSCWCPIFIDHFSNMRSMSHVLNTTWIHTTVHKPNADHLMINRASSDSASTLSLDEISADLLKRSKTNFSKQNHWNSEENSTRVATILPKQSWTSLSHPPVLNKTSLWLTVDTCSPALRSSAFLYIWLKGVTTSHTSPEFILEKYTAEKWDCVTNRSYGGFTCSLEVVTSHLEVQLRPSLCSLTGFTQQLIRFSKKHLKTWEKFLVSVREGQFENRSDIWSVHQ